MMHSCTLCPRECGADRENGIGFCGAGKQIKLARAALHNWEEPCISYQAGSGTVFFSGCSLQCVFCQNFEISREHKGKEISVADLSELFLRLQSEGAVNLNLVNPTHYVLQIMEALDLVKHKLAIPVVYNTGGYDKAETLKRLEGYIDIYLPDIKYVSSELSQKYSSACNYFEIASKAVVEMHRQCGDAVFGSEGEMKKGVLIRHLVLPSHRADSKRVLEFIASTFDVSKTAISLMRQYFPTYQTSAYKEINRRLTTLEYDDVVGFARTLGFQIGFIQSKESANSIYVPDFDF
jgi:Uncharacterized Fe-S protein PflX, homolog of pyruvate formate lyase activating proteins